MSGFELTVASREIKLCWPYELQSITSLQVIRNVNEHARIKFRGVLSDEQVDAYMEQVNHRDHIQVFKRVGDKEMPIFSGMVSNMMVMVDRGVYITEVEGVSMTYDLDVERKSRSYPNRSMTYDEVIRHILGPYRGGDYIDMAHGSDPLRKFLMQYEETDWRFLQRLASHTGAVLVPDITAVLPRFWFGMPELDPPVDIESKNYEIDKDIGKYIHITEADPASSFEEDYKAYRVTSEKLLPVGNVIGFNGQELVVAGSVIELRQGSVVMTYTFAPRRGIRQQRFSNPLLTGLSLDGKVTAVYRKMVQLHLDIDAEESLQNTCWFPYSAEGGNAWYSMPKAGGRVQLYFPDSIENHAFATSSIRGSGEGMKANPKMSNPNVKSFANDCGKVMELGERNISFTTDTMSITMDENGISFSNPSRIEITPAEELLLGEVESGAKLQGPPLLPKLVLRAEQSLSLMQGAITGLEIEDVHKLLSVKTMLEGTSEEVVSYEMLSSPGQLEAVATAKKLENYKLSEQRKIGGAMKILNGLTSIVAGATMVVIGAPVLALGISFGWTGVGILVGAAGGIGLTSGIAAITFGTAELWEGIQEYSLGSQGDAETPAFNFMRDTLFGGNEEAYQKAMDITMIVGGLALDFAAPFMLLASGKGLLGLMNRGNSQKTPPEVPEAPEVSSKPGKPTIGQQAEVETPEANTKKGTEGTDELKYWNKTAEFNGTKVYQRNDLIDPNLTDKLGRTNLERMKQGLAPIGPDGKSINLHHTIQTNDSAIAEVTQTFHKDNHSIIHINPNTIPSGINRAEFDKWRKAYWKNRANDFIDE